VLVPVDSLFPENRTCFLVFICLVIWDCSQDIVNNVLGRLWIWLYSLKEY
jgi:hypothetical protein